MANDNRRNSGRQNQNNKNRGRGRGRRQQNPANRSYESNGPDVKIRGNASTIVEKYLTLARDAQSAGDRVKAENYLQHAEHYQRIVNSYAPPPAQNEQADGDDEAAEEVKQQAADNGEATEAAQAEEKADEASASEQAADVAPEVAAEEAPKPKPRRTRKPRVVAKKDEAEKADAAKEDSAKEDSAKADTEPEAAVG